METKKFSLIEAYLLELNHGFSKKSLPSLRKKHFSIFLLILLAAIVCSVFLFKQEVIDFLLAVSKWLGVSYFLCAQIQSFLFFLPVLLLYIYHLCSLNKKHEHPDMEAYLNLLGSPHTRFIFNEIKCQYKLKFDADRFRLKTLMLPEKSRFSLIPVVIFYSAVNYFVVSFVDLEKNMVLLLISGYVFPVFIMFFVLDFFGVLPPILQSQKQIQFKVIEFLFHKEKEINGLK